MLQEVFIGIIWGVSFAAFEVMSSFAALVRC